MRLAKSLQNYHLSESSKVIKKYLNIPEKKNEVVKSIQQEMYKQMRIKLDDSIKDFNLSQERKLQQDISANEL